MEDEVPLYQLTARFAGASSSFAGETSAGRSIVRIARLPDGRERGEPPMGATSVATKGGSITATTFVPGGVGGSKLSGRR